MPKNGAINLDLEFDDEEDEVDEETIEDGPKSILDLTENQIVSARKKLKSGELLFPEEEEELKDMTKTRKKRSGGGNVPEVSQSILDEVGDALGEFDAETANKKQIRKLRKALQVLSLARYPKKKKTKKT